MTSEEIRMLVPQYLSEQLTPADKNAFEAQLNSSPELRRELEELRELWEGLGELPQEQPSAAVRARFYQKLNEIKTGRNSPITHGFAWWKPGLAGLVRQVAIALVLFTLGIFIGRKDLTSSPSTEEVKRLGSEVQNLRQTVALSLLERQSATSRLEGISWSSRVEQPDRDLVSALLAVLDHDPNINVRLSALDALGKFADDATIRKALVNSIPLQDSPLVQIALIDTLVNLRDNAAAGQLQKLTTDTNVNAAVRQRAQWGLGQLN
jgi:hypothetical protein